MKKVTYADTLSLAFEHSITPFRCAQCKQTTGNWKIGLDTEKHAQYLGYQCRDCGNTQSLRRRAILKRIKEAEA